MEQRDRALLFHTATGPGRRRAGSRATGRRGPRRRAREGAFAAGGVGDGHRRDVVSASVRRSIVSVRPSLARRRASAPRSRFLHQPMGEPAQRRPVRAAAVESRAPTARPDRARADAALVAFGEEQRQHRLQVGSGGTRRVGRRADGGGAQPAPPARRRHHRAGRGSPDDGRRRPRGRGRRKISSTVRSSGSPAGSRRRSPSNPSGSVESGTGGDQEGPPFFTHSTTMLQEIGRGQQAAATIAIEDHQIEVAQPLLEQLAGREGDQRQFLGGHEVPASRSGAGW